MLVEEVLLCRHQVAVAQIRRSLNLVLAPAILPECVVSLGDQRLCSFIAALMLVGVYLNAACSLMTETAAVSGSLVLLASLSLELLDLR